MTEMVERVAKTLFEENQLDNEAKYGSWNSAGEGAREEYRYMVRLAIGAMREPTVAMLDAGDSQMPQIASGQDITTGYDALKDAWPAMIDAALADAGVTISNDPSNTTSP